MTQTRRTFLQSAGLCAAGVAAGCNAEGPGANEAAPKAKPKHNVLFIFTDDQRWDTIHALGNKEIITPNLDRLAKRSFVFSQGFCFGGNTAAVCIPARNQAMSGKTFFRFPKRGRRACFADPKWGNFPKSMKAAGYETYYREKSGSSNLPEIRMDFEHREDVHQVNALRTGRPAQGIVDDAIQFITKDRDTDRPFFMYLGVPAPHDPRWSLKQFRAMYDQTKLTIPPNYRPQHRWNIGDMTVRDECLEVWPRTKEAIQRHLFDYYSIMTAMDHDLGRLLDTLENKALWENTIVIFSSDQGLAMGSHGLLGKQSIYDDVMRVPMLYAGPGIKPGTSDAFTYTHDIYPTVCEMVGASCPGDLDGRSVRGIMEGKAKSVHDYMVMGYTSAQRSISDGEWKLIIFPLIGKKELFHVKTDPFETKNLTKSKAPEAVAAKAKLRKALEAELKRLGDKSPLVVKSPKSAAFNAPTKKRGTRYPAGGQAPDEIEAEEKAAAKKK
ncbi:MAG: sulfatase-like hydrolase/transferase [Phycisphaerales bacterium]|jgi:arylsulfatase A-like enzyme|nr:sulfatase-like hydrolase/transferase [Phycisphaerales bacterium]MBT7171204.1 sulfatase-like hydrolase/transferase [Phycisphaerales bacterium]